MQVFWEKIRILVPVYRRDGMCAECREIAYDQDMTKARVRDCSAWMQHFLRCKDGNDLARGASHARVM